MLSVRDRPQYCEPSEVQAFGIVGGTATAAQDHQEIGLADVTLDSGGRVDQLDVEGILWRSQSGFCRARQTWGAGLAQLQAAAAAVGSSRKASRSTETDSIEPLPQRHFWHFQVPGAERECLRKFGDPDFHQLEPTDQLVASTRRAPSSA